MAFLNAIQLARRSDVIAEALAQLQSVSHQDLEQAQVHLALAWWVHAGSKTLDITWATAWVWSADMTSGIGIWKGGDDFAMEVSFFFGIGFNWHFSLQPEDLQGDIKKLWEVIRLTLITYCEISCVALIDWKEHKI
jgi:hypothetical protein